jgi:HK97 family phage portal protein
MDVGQIDAFRDLYDSRYAGPVNAGRPMILTEGLKMHALSMTAVDAQLLESIKYSVIDIARACGVPPVLIGAQETTSSWGTGVSEIKQGFVTFHLAPRANLWQQEMNRKLIRKDDEWVEFIFEGFLQSDAKAEGEALRQSVGGSQGPGWQTINEVRRIKNLPPIDGGDVLYIPKGNSNEQKTASAN